MQRITPRVGEMFQMVEDSLKEAFLPSIFQWMGTPITGWELTHLYTKYARLSLSYPTLFTPDNWSASCVLLGHLVVTIQVRI